MKKKTAGQICAEVFIEYNKKDIQKGLCSGYSYEVVDNIHKNPELLEVKNESKTGQKNI